MGAEDWESMKKENEALHQRLAAMEEAQEIAHLGSWEWDRDDDRVTGSDEFYRLMSVKPGLLTDRHSFFQLIHPDDVDSVKHIWLDALESEQIIEMVFRRESLDGRIRHLLARSRVVRDDKDRPVGLVGTCLDITRRKLAEVAREESEARYRRLFESMMDCFVQTNMEGEIVLVNHSFVDLLGYTEEELRQLSYKDLTPEKWHSVEDEIVNTQILSRGYSEVYEKEYLRRDGRVIPVELRTFLLRDANGEPAGMWAIVRNVTRRKEAEQALRESEARYRHTLDEMLEGCQIISPDWHYLYVNEAVASHARVPREKLVGKSMMQVFPGIETTEMFAVLQQCLRERSSQRIENIFYYPDGSSRIFELRIKPVPEGLFILSIDITERKQIEDELRKHGDELEQRVHERTAELEEANRALDAFTYSVSHDLRAPLRAIDGFTHILLENHQEQLDEEGLRIGGVIRSNTRKMGKLIDDLLAFSRMGRKIIDPQVIDMQSLARLVFDDLTDEESRVRIRFNIGELPVAVGDPALIRQVWSNLLSNAIKFTSHRETPVISVKAECLDQEAMYWVEDNGAGFDMHQADKLFTVFQRLHNSEVFEGTGVGLALVKGVIEKHGGRVWAEGVEDEGASFYFTLPENQD
ncbi:MAG: PAS domain S-box protein [Anaerolineales bacterium]|nr:PAS domain S-box protein [Anaerolineales bacterium]